MDWSDLLDVTALAALVTAVSWALWRRARSQDRTKASDLQGLRDVIVEQSARIDKLHRDIERTEGAARKASERAAVAESRAASAEDSARRAAETVASTLDRLARVEQRADMLADYIEATWEYETGGRMGSYPCPPRELYDVLDMSKAPRKPQSIDTR